MMMTMTVVMTVVMNDSGNDVDIICHIPATFTDTAKYIHHNRWDTLKTTMGKNLRLFSNKFSFELVGFHLNSLSTIGEHLWLFSPCQTRFDFREDGDVVPLLVETDLPLEVKKFGVGLIVLGLPAFWKNWPLPNRDSF